MNNPKVREIQQLPAASKRTLWRHTLKLWAFGIMKIPLIFYLRPRVLELTDHMIALKVYLRRRTKNHYGTMYFGALATGAEMIPGIFSTTLARKLGKRASFMTAHLEADFVERATGDVVFYCCDGNVIEEQIRTSATTKVSVKDTIEVVATSLTDQGEQVVAQFRFILSIKAK